jgi:thiamine-monophosphate kinase
VGAVIETAWVQDSAAISDAMQSVAFNKRLDFALAGGDDYELLFTASPDQADEVLEAGERCGVSITCIGRITPLAGVQVLDLQGLPLSRRFASFEHFAH